MNLREYQEQAIESLIKNDFHGILSMATGSGKTITSIYSAKSYLEREGRMFLIIVVPFIHLIDQWAESLEKANFHDCVVIHGFGWKNRLKEEIRDFNAGIANCSTVMVTYTAARRSYFDQIIRSVEQHSFLIADECHYFGSTQFRNSSLKNCSARIGLSATPTRWWDSEGTEFIEKVFDKVTFEFKLEEAIREGYLTSYNYYPVIVELAPEEVKQYGYLTQKIAKLYAQKESRQTNEEQIHFLLLKRAKVIAKAKNKLPKLISMLNKETNIMHTLVYCAPGTVDEVVKAISGLGIRVHRFNIEVSKNERSKLLKDFSEGLIQVLVAVKCLDEGVDVPSTQKAYFLSSTTNPREFIQRRGRILRRNPGKKRAEIIDFITFPPDSHFENDDEIRKKIAVYEMPRFAEFSIHALNMGESRRIMSQALEPYQLEHLMDLLPSDVYQKNKAKGDI